MAYTALRGLGCTGWVAYTAFRGLGCTGRVAYTGFRGLGCTGRVAYTGFRGLGCRGWWHTRDQGLRLYWAGVTHGVQGPRLNWARAWGMQKVQELRLNWLGDGACTGFSWAVLGGGGRNFTHKEIERVNASGTRWH